MGAARFTPKHFHTDGVTGSSPVATTTRGAASRKDLRLLQWGRRKAGALKRHATGVTHDEISRAQARARAQARTSGLKGCMSHGRGSPGVRNPKGVPCNQNGSGMQDSGCCTAGFAKFIRYQAKMGNPHA